VKLRRTGRHTRPSQAGPMMETAIGKATPTMVAVVLGVLFGSEISTFSLAAPTFLYSVTRNILTAVFNAIAWLF